MIENHIRPAWNDRPLASITRHDVQEWASQLVLTNRGDEDAPRYLASSSARRYLNVFVSSLTAALDADLLPANPAVRIKLPPLPPSRNVFLTKDQYFAIREAVPHRDDRAVLDFLVGTGARWGEMAGFHIDRLDLKQGEIIVAEVWDGYQIKPYPKGRRQRRVPILQWAVDNLDVPHDLGDCGETHKLGKCRSSLLFPARRGGVRDDRNFTRQVWAKAVKSAGLSDLGATLHDLRHTYASWLIQDGMKLERVSELLGHASIQTTQIYAHLAPLEREELEAALSAPRGANEGQTSTSPHYAGLRAVPREIA